jgi:hypothetical protein
MKAKELTIAAGTALLVLATRTVEVAQGFGSSQSITIIDTFRETHPVLMIIFNLGGIFLLIVVCVSFFSMLTRNSNGK